MLRVAFVLRSTEIQPAFSDLFSIWYSRPGGVHIRLSCAEVLCSCVFRFVIELFVFSDLWCSAPTVSDVLSSCACVCSDLFLAWGGLFLAKYYDLLLA